MWGLAGPAQAKPAGKRLSSLLRAGDWTIPVDVEGQKTADTNRSGVRHASAGKVALIWGLSCLIRVWCRTLRFEISKDDLVVATHDAPSVVLLWHNRLFIVPWALRHLRFRRPVCGLVSASRDGAALAAFFRFLGIRAVRGSSSRLGREALHELIAICRAGNDVAITPDGPRGPIYSMRAGAVLAARRLDAPMILLGFEFSSPWRLRSWDRFCLPRPFTHVRVRAELFRPSDVARRNEGVEHIRRRLLEINGESVSECSTPSSDPRTPRDAVVRDAP